MEEGKDAAIWAIATELVVFNVYLVHNVVKAVCKHFYKDISA